MRNFRPPDWTASERRRHRILDALFKAAERQGVRVKQPDRFTLFFETSGERVNFKLSEKQKQVRVPKTPAEMQGLRPGEKTWRQQLQPTGFLSFSIETYLPTLPQRVWGESTDQPLEEKLGDILAVLLLAGPLLVKQRREREQAEKRRREALRSARQVPLRRPPRSPSRASPSTRSATPAIPAWRFALERIRRVHSGLLQPEVSQHRETLSSHVATALLIDISAWLMVFDGCAKLLRNRGRMDTYGSHSNVQPFVAQSRHFRLEIPKSGLV